MNYFKNQFDIRMPSNFRKSPPEEPKTQEINSWWEIIKFAIIAFLIIVPIRMYIVQPFIVSGESMIPTFHDGDYLVIDEISYRFHKPRRGDVIVFHPPQEGKGIYYIKRVIGLPNETVTLTGTKVIVANDIDKIGVELKEPYLQNISSDKMVVHVGPDELFVMGDNRPRSSDSRKWGTLPLENITGRALLRLFPFRTLEYLPGAQQVYNAGDNKAVALK